MLDGLHYRNDLMPLKLFQLRLSVHSSFFLPAIPAGSPPLFFLFFSPIYLSPLTPFFFHSSFYSELTSSVPSFPVFLILLAPGLRKIFVIELSKSQEIILQDLGISTGFFFFFYIISFPPSATD